MPNKRLNVLYPRRYTVQGEEQVHWMTIGVAWQTDKGIDIKLWVVPPFEPGDGQIKLLAREPRQGDEEGYQDRGQGNQERGQQRGQQRSGGGPRRAPQRGQAQPPQQQERQPGADEADDDLPF